MGVPTSPGPCPTPERSLDVAVNGQSGAANTTLTDGTRNVNVGLPHHNIYIPPAETIESVNITTGSMDAEEGMAAGARITRTEPALNVADLLGRYAFGNANQGAPAGAPDSGSPDSERRPASPRENR